MASGEGSPRASREVTMDALLAAIMRVKHYLSGRMERMDGMESSFSRRMDTLEVHLDSNHSSPKHYHSTSGHATTPDTLHHYLIHLDQPINPSTKGPYGGEGLDEATLFAEFVRNRREAYGRGHRGREGRFRPDPQGRGNLGHRPHIQEGLVDQGVTKNDVSEKTSQEDDGDDGEAERVVEEGKVNVPCRLMRRTPYDDVLSNDVDLLNPPAEIEKKKHKLKRLVQSPNSFFMWNFEVMDDFVLHPQLVYWSVDDEV
ncbi:40S ribosomal protein S27-1 [Capsicum chinense]|nr:40S ribosomal protein S27-1 [Capsicum chinense]